MITKAIEKSRWQYFPKAGELSCIDDATLLKQGPALLLLLVVGDGGGIVSNGDGSGAVVTATVVIAVAVTDLVAVISIFGGGAAVGAVRAVGAGADLVLTLVVMDG